MKTFKIVRLALCMAAALTVTTGMMSAKEQKVGPKELKVISYNVRLGTAVKKDKDNCWDNRKPATRAMLQEQRPDVMGVQEAYDFQIDYISGAMPVYKNVGVGRDDGVNKGEHMSIFYDTTKVVLLDWGTYWLSETPDVPSKGWGAACKRTATWTKFRHISSGKEFFYVNTHLDHKSMLARRKGLALIVDNIAKMNPGGKLPMILTGDFNVRPQNVETLGDLDKIMLSARNTAKKRDTHGSFNGFGKYGASDAAPTWEGAVPLKACPILDYIYYSKFSKCKVFRVLDTPYAGIPYISDHYPIMSILKF